MSRHGEFKDLQINWNEYKHNLEDSDKKFGFISTNVYRKALGMWEEGSRYWPNVMTNDGRDVIINNAYITTSRTGRGFNALAASTNAGGASVTHTALAGEITTNGLQRAYANTQIAHTAGTNSSLLDHIWTASGAHTAVQLIGTFDNNTAPVTPTMGHEGTIGSTDLASGDKLQVQYTLNLA